MPTIIQNYSDLMRSFRLKHAQISRRAKIFHSLLDRQMDKYINFLIFYRTSIS